MKLRVTIFRVYTEIHGLGAKPIFQVGKIWICLSHGSKIDARKLAKASELCEADFSISAPGRFFGLNRFSTSDILCRFQKCIGLWVWDVRQSWCGGLETGD